MEPVKANVPKMNPTTAAMLKRMKFLRMANLPILGIAMFPILVPLRIRNVSPTL